MAEAHEVAGSGHGLDMTALPQVAAVLENLRTTLTTNRLALYQPYPFQADFHASKAPDGTLARQRLLMAGNKVGKTWAGASEVAIHATGRYPDWWDGWRFDRPISAWCAGVTTISTRDIVQAELLGDPAVTEALGTGAIPKECIGKSVRSQGIPNALDSVMVKHVSGGWSKIQFKAYEQGFEKFQGSPQDVNWCDEEPPWNIFSQLLRASLPTHRTPKGGIIITTMTPENGMTDVVAKFVNDLGPGQAIYRATWDDAPHLTPEVQEQILSTLLPHEREMRRAGVPVLGSGLVYPVHDDQIATDPVEIAAHWPRIAGMDFGWDHPTAVVWVAHNPDSDTVYVYDVHAQSQATPVIHAHAIKQRGIWIPCAWPHDGEVQDHRSSNAGTTLAQQYRDLGVNMLPRRFSNPPGSDGKENNSVAPGIMEILTRMQTGRFKVFTHLAEWFKEKNQYHRVDGKIVTKRDDLMAATRYAVMSLRFAAVNRGRAGLRAVAIGAEDDYNPLNPGGHDRADSIPDGVHFEGY